MTTKQDTVVRRALDLRPFARAARELDADPNAWLETSYLIAELTRNGREPIPGPVLAHLRDRLDGTAKKRQGRGRVPRSKAVRDAYIWVHFERTEAWLKAREASQGLAGWKRIRTAEWWQGPPSERAARMVQHGLGLNLDWQSVRNIAYQVRKNGVPKV